MGIAVERRHVRTLMGYVNGLLDAIPMLAQMVESRTSGAIHLTNNVTIQIHTSSFKIVRGYTVGLAVVNEAAFLSQENSAEPDVELVNAIKPGMATLTSSMLLVLSSPWRRICGKSRPERTI